MSNSRRHAPVCSDHRLGWYRRFRAHRERARLLQRLRHGNYDVDFELSPWDEWDCPRDGKQWEPDYFDGEVRPDDWWNNRIHGAYKARIKQFDPDLAAKRRSK